MKITKKLPVILILSFLISFFLDSPNRAQDEKNENVAVIIGINDYMYLSKLKAARNDATDIVKFFSEKNYKLYTLLDDDKDFKNKPLRISIKMMMENIEKRYKDSGISNLVFYFAGHGVSVNGASYICSLDTQIDDKNGLVGIDAEIIPWLRRINAKSSVVILDACRNNITLSRSSSVRGLKVIGNVKKIKSRKTDNSGIFVMYAARPGEYSYEMENGTNGYFTHFLIKGLNGEADKNNDNKIEFIELASYLRRWIPDTTEAEVGMVQVPYIGGDYDPAAGFNFGESALSSEDVKLKEIARNDKRPVIEKMEERRPKWIHSRWQLAEPMGTAHSGNYIACTYNGKIYVVSGRKQGGCYTGNEYTDKLEVYNPYDNKWSYLASCPFMGQVEYFGSDGNGNLLAIFGGTNCDTPFSGEMFLYNVNADQWTHKGKMPRPLGESGVTNFRDHVYVMTGCSRYMGGNLTTSTDSTRYSINSGKWNSISPISQGRAYPAITFCDRKIYVISGMITGWRDNPPEKHISSVEIYDIDNDTWSRGADFPKKDQGLSASVINGDIYVFGGRKTNKNDIYKYIRKEDKWVSGGSSPYPIDHASTVTLYNSIYFIGNFEGDKRVLVFSPDLKN